MPVGGSRTGGKGRKESQWRKTDSHNKRRRYSHNELGLSHNERGMDNHNEEIQEHFISKAAHHLDCTVGETESSGQDMTPIRTLALLRNNVRSNIMDTHKIAAYPNGHVLGYLFLFILLEFWIIHNWLGTQEMHQVILGGAVGCWELNPRQTCAT